MITFYAVAHPVEGKTVWDCRVEGMPKAWPLWNICLGCSEDIRDAFISDVIKRANRDGLRVIVKEL